MPFDALGRSRCSQGLGMLAPRAGLRAGPEQSGVGPLLTVDRACQTMNSWVP